MRQTRRLRRWRVSPPLPDALVTDDRGPRVDPRHELAGVDCDPILVDNDGAGGSEGVTDANRHAGGGVWRSPGPPVVRGMGWASHGEAVSVPGAASRAADRERRLSAVVVDAPICRARRIRSTTPPTTSAGSGRSASRSTSLSTRRCPPSGRPTRPIGGGVRACSSAARWRGSARPPGPPSRRLTPGVCVSRVPRSSLRVRYKEFETGEGRPRQDRIPLFGILFLIALSSPAPKIYR